MADKIALVSFVESVRFNQTENKVLRAAGDKCGFAKTDGGVDVIGTAGQARLFVPYANVRFLEYASEAVKPVKAA